VPVGLAGRAVDALGNVLTSTNPARSRRLVEELTWLTTVVVLLAFIGIVVWNQRDALRNPEPIEEGETVNRFVLSSAVLGVLAARWAGPAASL
jgi:hypothetical protein